MRIAAAHDEPALLNCVSDHATHQCIRTNCIVVARDRELDHIGVDVCVDDGDHGNLQLVGLGDRNVLLLGVEDEHSIRTLVHATDTAEVLLQLLEFATEQQRFLLRHRVELTRDLHALVLLHLGDTLGDRFEVREHATEPTLVDVRHTALLGVAAHGILCLLLRADEQHVAALGRQVTNEGVRGLDAGERLLEIDDVDTAALTKDEPLHLWVPTAGLVPEVHAGFQHLAHRDNSHDRCLLLCG